MAITYTTAAAREARARTATRTAFDPWELALAGVSVLAVLLILTAFGRASTMRNGGTAGIAPVNLNAIADPAALEPVVARVLPGPADRRLAARALFATLVQADGARRAVGEVRVLSRARVDAAAIDRAPLATAYRARLDEAGRARAAARTAPQSISALSRSDLTEIKPWLAVRTARDVRGMLLLWGVLYVLACHAVSLTWRLRRVRGDRMLLVCVHVLTAFGLAAMVSRPDPIRDGILFVRFAEGAIAGLAVAAVASCVNLRTAVFRHLSFVPLCAAFVLSIALLVFGGGPAGSGAKVNLGPFQPIEAIRVLLALFLADTSRGTGTAPRRPRRSDRRREDAGLDASPRPRYVLAGADRRGTALVLFSSRRISDRR